MLRTKNSKITEYVDSLTISQMNPLCSSTCEYLQHYTTFEHISVIVNYV